VNGSTDEAFVWSKELDELLRAGIRELAGLEAPAANAAATRLRRFASLLADANQRSNLTRIFAPRDMVERHFLDAAAGYGLLREMELARGGMVDVGSGPGVPGLVWSALGGFREIVCCDSNRKKAEFIRSAAEDLGLRDVAVAGTRSETLGRDPARRESFDIATGRALASLNLAMELTAPLVRIGGHCLYFKGREADREIEEADRAMRLMGLELVERRRYAIPESDHGGELLLFRKVHACPAKYPRRPGIPAKRPL
jgi:16S rRNA (guanine527-N7)-methyltransferase